MFCPKCGRKLPDGAKFCSGCGKKLTETTAEKPKVKVPVDMRGTTLHIMAIFIPVIGEKALFWLTIL